MVKKLYEYALKLKTGALRKGLIVEWDGNFGEIAPLPHFSKETFEEAKKETLLWLKNDIEPKLPSVRFGIACAQRPLQSVHIPLSSLGPKTGFSTMKLKVGHLTVTEAVNLARTYLGKARLRLDFNQKWKLGEALEFAKHFDPNDFEYLEEPVNPDALIEFSNETAFPIALDESQDRNWDEIPSLKAIVIKPTIVGSIPKVPSHLKLVLSSSYETGLGLLHIANLARDTTPIGLDTYEVFEEDILTEAVKCQNGYFSWNQTTPPVNTDLLCAL